MSLAISTKLHVARTATLAAYDEAISSKAGGDVLELLQAAIDRLNEAEKIRRETGK